MRNKLLLQAALLQVFIAAFIVGVIYFIDEKYHIEETKFNMTIFMVLMLFVALNLFKATINIIKWIFNIQPSKEEEKSNSL